MAPHFRFKDVEIWQDAAEMSVKFHKLVEKLERQKLYRYAEQLRAAGLSLPNNISEGAGSVHAPEFKQFLTIARRSCFEDASVLLVFEKMVLVEREEIGVLLDDCDRLSRKITNFSRIL